MMTGEPLTILLVEDNLPWASTGWRGTGGHGNSSVTG